VADINSFLRERSRSGLLRVLRPAASRRAGMINIGGREYVDFSSNDYLGLSNHPKILEASKKAIEEFGAGSPASRLLSGDLDIHHRLEEDIALFKNKEAALIFNSGYQANVGIISSIYSRKDAIFSDRLNHASILDGIMLSGSRLFRFDHNDTGHLEYLLKKERGDYEKALIVTETVFSMDGDRAPLRELVTAKERYDCRIMVDEAHATGLFGAKGSGLVEEAGLSDRVDLVMGTFGKALGGFGAYLASSKEMIEYLVNTCRSFIYSTALPPAVIGAGIAAIAVVAEEPERRRKLLKNAEYFRSSLAAMGINVKGSSQIVPMIIGDNDRAVELAGAFQEKGYWVLPIRPPTVPHGEARLRFSLTVDHEKAVLDRLLNDISLIGI